MRPVLIRAGSESGLPAPAGSPGRPDQARRPRRVPGVASNETTAALAALQEAIEGELSPHQSDMLVVIALDGVPPLERSTPTTIVAIVGLLARALLDQWIADPGQQNCTPRPYACSACQIDATRKPINWSGTGSCGL